MNPNGVRDPGHDQFGETCSEEGHVHGCPGMAGGDHELAGPPVPNPDPDLAYRPDGSVAGRVSGWINGVPVLGDYESDSDWFEDDEGFVRAPLSYENREGDPAFNGALDKW